ncbi:cilia- and flagella-associated protein 65 [Syngnathus typhle]|uniref:cilia- and flagella-associated protein 65 n=1 Tax=Syngnathus typhle TaxID=161592 RepID=UPI002A6AE6F4|nr:cilia- and flagella-associated protein 65 [Syngnathus typhle]
MLAELEGPKTNGSDGPWTSSIIISNTKQAGTQHKHQRRVPVQRSCFLGLETKPELLWEDWLQGREYTKSLTLKNISLKLQKLHLRPPLTKFFSISSSCNLAVSPGTSLTILITFKPAEKCKYEDSLEFEGKDGRFQVLLRAVVPYPALEVPEAVLLPLCAVHQSVTATFLLKNLSKLRTYFSWECPEPFQVSPEEGVLKASQEISLLVLFQPQQALLYNKRAFCRFGEEGDQAECCATLRLQGVGTDSARMCQQLIRNDSPLPLRLLLWKAKYPCLQLRGPSWRADQQHGGPVVNFGSVAVGQRLQKCFDICNPSHVTAFFSLTRLSGGVPLLGSDFVCDVTSGRVAPGASVTAKVAFAPTVAGSVSVDYLTAECKGALNQTVLKLIGHCAGPKLSFSSSVVDFGCVRVGAAASQTMELINSSCVQATFQWDLDCAGHSVFSIQPQCGTLAPKSRVALTVTYLPTVPFAHRRSVPCFILHGDPLFLDLIGTCHSDLQKPAVLKPEHLASGPDDWSDVISALLPSNSTQLDPQAFCISATEKSSRLSNISTARSMTPREDSDEADSLSSSSPSTRVSVAPSELLFNQVTTSVPTSTSSSLSQGVAVTNNSTAKITLVWTNARDSPFSISPWTCDLSPLKSTSFRVTYNPKERNALHAAQLECFAVQLASGGQISPPCCVIVRVIGHSFERGKEHFYPQCSLEPSTVEFAGLNVRTYKTLLLRNHGEHPLTFCRSLNESVDPAAEASVSIVPRCGLLLPGAHQILTAITAPKEDSPPEGIKLRLQLNSSQCTKEITVISKLETISVSFEGGGIIYFQDTSVGSPSKRTHLIRNVCRVPLGFRWNIRYLDQHLISVQPDAGELQVNESVQQKWSFNPKEEKTYVLQPALSFWPLENPGSKNSIVTLQVMGKGAKGSIQALTEIFEMGETLVGRAQSLDIPLVNNSTCSISFRICIEQTLRDEQPHQDFQPAATALQLDCTGGTVASRSTFMLRATFRPDRQARYRWTISYQTLSCSGTSGKHQTHTLLPSHLVSLVQGVLLSPPQEVCEVRANGVFPIAQVSDVGSGGVAAWLNKSYVWKLLSVDSLNAQLLSMPSPVEHTYRNPRRHSMRTYPSILIKAMLDFNFGAAPLNSEPSTFAVAFHNPGSIPVEWTFLFPDDQQVDFKHWSRGQELGRNELELMQIGELFSVSPLSATLLSGEQKSVQFTYSHAVAGTHQLPVILKISHGREILLLLQGVTVEQERAYLYFLSRHHVFTPIMTGGLTPPLQVGDVERGSPRNRADARLSLQTYELYNGGDVPVHYEVDGDVLSQLQESNFNQPLLSCLNPAGVVLPGKTAKLEFIFSPLEAKMHSMDVPIHIRHGETATVRFEGLGFDAHEDVWPSGESTPAARVRRIALPGQRAFLSADNIALGELPVCSQSSRIFFLTNVSSEEIFFKWCLTQVIRIQPKQGLLRPGERIICVLTFMATDFPTVHYLDIVCQLTEQAALVQYSASLQLWEQEREQRQHEFTITERDLAESRKVPSDKVSPQTQLGKYKTLPPICSRVARAEQRAQAEADKLAKRPTLPQPSLLHLEVTARTYRWQEYLRYFPDRFNHLFRCFRTIKPLRPKLLCNTLLQEGRPLQKLGPERHFLEHILTSLIRSILDNEAFSQSLLTLASKPLFYKPKVIFSAPSSIPQPLIGLEETNPELHFSADGSAAAGGAKLRMGQCAERIPVDVLNDILLNTLQNVMMEAVRGELDLIESSPNVSIRSRRHAGGKVKKDDKETSPNTATPADKSSSSTEQHTDTS